MHVNSASSCPWTSVWWQWWSSGEFDPEWLGDCILLPQNKQVIPKLTETHVNVKKKQIRINTLLCCSKHKLFCLSCHLKLFFLNYIHVNCENRRYCIFMCKQDLFSDQLDFVSGKHFKMYCSLKTHSSCSFYVIRLWSDLWWIKLDFLKKSLVYTVYHHKLNSELKNFMSPTRYKTTEWLLVTAKKRTDIPNFKILRDPHITMFFSPTLYKR